MYKIILKYISIIKTYFEDQIDLRAFKKRKSEEVISFEVLLNELKSKGKI